jgi:hypothetical protein
MLVASALAVAMKRREDDTLGEGSAFPGWQQLALASLRRSIAVTTSPECNNPRQETILAE